MRIRAPKCVIFTLRDKMDKKSFSMAYGAKRKKKMAKGGQVNESAASEKRPMPSEVDKDASMVHQNSSAKAPAMGDSLKQDDISSQAKRGGKFPLKHPKMVPSNAFSVRLITAEDDLMDSAKPNRGPQEQPPKADVEKGANRQGPVADALDELKGKKHAKGGMINKAVSMQSAEEDMEQHPADLESDDDQMAPDEDEFMADHFAEGGAIDEQELEHAASLAAAIMAKRKMARGGAVLSEDSMESDDSDMADLNRNAQEDANMEDKASFDAIRKENYSEADGLDALDQPEDSDEHSPEHEDMDVNDDSLVSSIRRRMRAKSAISR